jgi:hypothetical protein
MRNANLKAIACRISRGGFSDERVFELGVASYRGVASRRHMWNVDGAPLEDGEPPLGKVIKGFVAARVIQIDPSRKVAMVSIPDGEVIEVPIAQLVERPAEHVPV